ncbi:hypothetical protein TNCV_2354631 [Trichonephila clavipes]|nr:hypothetical protein TNCV_2354631 [Trichonephila clavipes]
MGPTYSRLVANLGIELVREGWDGEGGCPVKYFCVTQDFVTCSIVRLGCYFCNCRWEELAGQLIDRDSSRKRKGGRTRFQEETRVVPDDARLASEGNHMPNMASNYRKCLIKIQEMLTLYMCAECDISLCLSTCFSCFHDK